MHRRATNRAGGGIVKYRQQAQLFTMPPQVSLPRRRSQPALTETSGRPDGGVRSRYRAGFAGEWAFTTPLQQTRAELFLQRSVSSLLALSLPLCASLW